VLKGVEVDKLFYVKVMLNGGLFYWCMVIVVEEGLCFMVIV